MTVMPLYDESRALEARTHTYVWPCGGIGSTVRQRLFYGLFSQLTPFLLQWAFVSVAVHYEPSRPISSPASGEMQGGGAHHGEMMGGMDMSPPTPMAMPPPGDPGMHMMGGMDMTFFWGKDVQVLFSGWPGHRHGVLPYLLALLAVFALAVLVESLSYAARRLSRSSSSSPPTSMAAGLAQAAVHAVRVGLAYLVMLAVMSFNGGVLIAAVAGHALGFFLFGSGAFATGAPAGEAAHAPPIRPSSEDKP